MDRCRIDVHSYLIYGIFDRIPESILKFFFGNIVLIHPDADTSDGDFDEFREGIEIPSSDGDRSAIRHIEIGEFFLGSF